MESPREVLVIYRLKFKSKDDFEKAAQTLRFGQKMGIYLESLQASLRLQQSQPNYPMIRPPEINICQDDLVIYICSYEYDVQHRKGFRTTSIMTQDMADTIPPFAHYSYYYEPFLRATFGTVADLTVTAEEYS
jgi:hypothetical protein